MNDVVRPPAVSAPPASGRSTRMIWRLTTSTSPFAVKSATSPGMLSTIKRDSRSRSRSASSCPLSVPQLRSSVPDRPRPDPRSPARCVRASQAARQHGADDGGGSRCPEGRKRHDADQVIEAVAQPRDVLGGRFDRRVHVTTAASRGPPGVEAARISVAGSFVIVHASHVVFAPSSESAQGSASAYTSVRRRHCARATPDHNRWPGPVK